MSESVLKRIARGDEHAVADCIDEFGSLIWALARRLSRTRADAERAALTGMPLGTVKTNMRRGLIQVRELMNVVIDEAAGDAQS